MDNTKSPGHKRRFFDKVCKDAGAQWNPQRDCAKFLSALLQFDDPVDLLYCLTNPNELGGQRLKAALSYNGTAEYIATYVVPLLRLLGGDALCGGTCRAPLMQLLEQIYRVPGLLGCLQSAVSSSQVEDASPVGWFLLTLASQLEEVRLNTEVHQLAADLAARGGNATKVARKLQVVLAPAVAATTAPVAAGTAIGGAPVVAGTSGVAQLACGHSLAGAEGVGGPGLEDLLAGPGGRHDNDHADYRSIKIITTSDEALCARMPYLPRAHILASASDHDGEDEGQAEGGTGDEDADQHAVNELRGNQDQLVNGSLDPAVAEAATNSAGCSHGQGQGQGHPQPRSAACLTDVQDYSHLTDPEAALLDRQFRLLREDFVQTLRQALSALGFSREAPKAGPMAPAPASAAAASSSQQRHQQQQPLTPAAAAAQRQVYPIVAVQRVETRPRPCALVAVTLPPGHRAARMASVRERVEYWSEYGKGVLPMDALVCVARRPAPGVAPQPLLFGTIARREPEEMARERARPVVGLAFERGQAGVELLLAELGRGARLEAEGLVLIQVSTSFFAVRPVLSCLQAMTGVPLPEELVLGQQPRPLEYLRQEGDVVPVVEQELSRLAEQGLVLDPSQREALECCLSQRVALVQGPPGTGKTFVGALVCDAIVRHSSETILVVCYTNHALDQFLEALLAKGITNLVRVGGRSKNKALEKYNLRELTGPGNPNRQRISQAEHRRLVVLKGNVACLEGQIANLQHLLLCTAGAKAEEGDGPAKTGITPVRPAVPPSPSSPVGIKRPSAEAPTSAPPALGKRRPRLQGDGRKAGRQALEGADGKPSPRELRKSGDGGVDGGTGEGVQEEGAVGVEGAAMALEVREMEVEVGVEVGVEGGVERQTQGLEGRQAPREQGGHRGGHEQQIERAEVAPSGAHQQPARGDQKGQERPQGQETQRRPDQQRQQANRQQRQQEQQQQQLRKRQRRQRPDRREVERDLTDSGDDEALPRAESGPVAADGFDLWLYLAPYLESEYEEEYEQLQDEQGGKRSWRAWLAGQARPQATNAASHPGDGGVHNTEADGAGRPGTDRKEYGSKYDRSYRRTMTLLFRQMAASTGEDVLAGERLRAASGGAGGAGCRQQASGGAGVGGHDAQAGAAALATAGGSVSDTGALWRLSYVQRLELAAKWLRELRSRWAEDLAAALASSHKLQSELRALHDGRTRAVLRGARVIGCTTTGAALHKDLLRGADVEPGVVLVEEAGELLEAHVLTSLSQRTKHLIMIGDHKQLRPKVECYSLAVQSGLGYDLNVSLFERLVLSGFPHTTLAVQHRMHPDISALVRPTYPALEDAGRVKEHPPVRGLAAGRRVVFVDHRQPELGEKGPSMWSAAAGQVSKVNPHEVSMVREVVCYLLRQGYQPGQLVVLTPYLGQLLELQRELSKDMQVLLDELDLRDLRAAANPGALAGVAVATGPQQQQRQQPPAAERAGGGSSDRGGAKAVRVATVDNYQGEEADVVVASLVRSNTAGKVGFLREPERINVLLSRARHGMLLIGNAQTLRNANSAEGRRHWGRVLDALEAAGAVLPGLPAACQRHGTESMLDSPQAFRAHTPNGGCQRPCHEALPCGHPCMLRCHAHDPGHDKVVCLERVLDVCPKGHTVMRRCATARATMLCMTCLEIENIAKEEQKDLRRLEEEEARKRRIAEISRAKLQSRIAQLQKRQAALETQRQARREAIRMELEAELLTKEVELQKKYGAVEMQEWEAQQRRDAREQLAVMERDAELQARQRGAEGAEAEPEAAAEAEAQAQKALRHDEEARRAELMVSEQRLRNLEAATDRELQRIANDRRRLLEQLEARRGEVEAEAQAGGLERRFKTMGAWREAVAQAAKGGSAGLEALRAQIREVVAGSPQSAADTAASLDVLFWEKGIGACLVGYCEEKAGSSEEQPSGSSGKEPGPRDADTSGAGGGGASGGSSAGGGGGGGGGASGGSSAGGGSATGGGVDSDKVATATGADDGSVSGNAVARSDDGAGGGAALRRGVSLMQEGKWLDALKFFTALADRTAAAAKPGPPRSTQPQPGKPHRNADSAGSRDVTTASKRPGPGTAGPREETVTAAGKPHPGPSPSHSLSTASLSLSPSHSIVTAFTSICRFKLGLEVTVPESAGGGTESTTGLDRKRLQRTPVPAPGAAAQEAHGRAVRHPAEHLAAAMAAAKQRGALHASSHDQHRATGRVAGSALACLLHPQVAVQLPPALQSEALRLLQECMPPLPSPALPAAGAGSGSGAGAGAPGGGSVQPEADWSERAARYPSLSKLLQLTGLAPVKRSMFDLAATVELDKERGRNLGAKQYNVRFYGNPGTGKTTVARLYAELLKELGVLPGVEVVATSGSELLTGGVSKLKEQLRKLDKGGVLFLDEAYQLNPKTNPMGAQVLDYLLPEMENRRGELVVVLAGYKKQMEDLMTHNEGLPSRFVQEFNFPDYSDDELFTIFRDLLANDTQSCFKVSEERYLRIAARRLGRQRGTAGFGNARAVRNAYEQAQRRQAARVLGERRRGLSPDPLSLEREDLLGPKHLDVSSCEALQELQGMRGLAAVKQQVADLLGLIRTNAELEEQERPLKVVNLNRIFLGNPGTGKTTVAGLYGRILRDLGLLSKGDVEVRVPADFVGSVLGESEKRTEAILEATKGCVLVIDEAYGLYSEGGRDPYREAVIDTLVARVQGVPGDDRCVLLLGYEEQMEAMMRKANPGLARRFQMREAWRFEDYGPEDLLAITREAAGRRGWQLEEAALLAAVEALELERRKPNFGNAGAVNNLLSSAALRMEARLRDLPPERRAAAVPQAEDFLPPRPGGDPAGIFDDLVGCKEVLAKLREWQATIRACQALGRDPLQSFELNFRFVGSPGTGKTTVAHRVGRLFESLGLLPGSELVSCSASDFVTGYVNQSSGKTREIFKKAVGGVLFIDEAYRLNPKVGGPFMQEVLDEIVQLLTEPAFMGKMVVILAGYDKQIAELMTINPGLKSRFSQCLRFPDFTAKDAAALLRMQLRKEYGLELSAEAEAVLPGMAEKLVAAPNWSNGRDVGTWAKRAFTAFSARNFPAEAGGNNSAPDLDVLVLADLQTSLDSILQDKTPPIRVPVAPTQPPESSHGNEAAKPPADKQDGPAVGLPQAEDPAAAQGFVWAFGFAPQPRVNLPAHCEASLAEARPASEVSQEEPPPREPEAGISNGGADFGGLSPAFLTAMQDALESRGHDLSSLAAVQELAADPALASELVPYLSVPGVPNPEVLREMVRQWQAMIQQRVEEERELARKKQRPVWRCAACGRYGCPVAPYIERYEEC